MAVGLLGVAQLLRGDEHGDSLPVLQLLSGLLEELNFRRLAGSGDECDFLGPADTVFLTSCDIDGCRCRLRECGASFCKPSNSTTTGNLT